MRIRYDGTATARLTLNSRYQRISKLESTVAKQNEMIAQQQKQIEALTATVQKVSDQMALSKAAPQLVANP